MWHAGQELNANYLCYLSKGPIFLFLVVDFQNVYRYIQGIVTLQHLNCCLVEIMVVSDEVVLFIWLL